MRAWLAHHHASVLLRIECNSNILMTTFLPFRCNLLNEHLAHFTFFPVGGVVINFGHLFSAHTIGTLSRAQFYSSSPSSTLNVNLFNFSINELTKFRFGSVIKSIIEAIQILILCCTYVTITTKVIE